MTRSRRRQNACSKPTQVIGKSCTEHRQRELSALRECGESVRISASGLSAWRRWKPDRPNLSALPKPTLLEFPPGAD